MSDPYLSVVVPAYNEEMRLRKTLDGIVAYFDERNFDFEVLVIDDGSTDATAQIAAEAEFEEEGSRLRLLRSPENRGKGDAVRRGMLASCGLFALLTDSDLSTPIAEVTKLEAKISEGFDIAFGSRDLPDSQIELRQPWMRERVGKGFNRVIRWIFGLPFRDTQCGFKLFRMERCRKVFDVQTIEGFVFDVEVLFIAREQGLRLAEVPVVWRHAEGSKVSVLGDTPATILDLWRIYWNYLRGRYKID